MGVPSNRFLLAPCLWAGAAMVAVAVTDSMVARTVLGAPMVFFVCGHTLLRAAGIRASSVEEHLAYAVGASLAIGVAGGFALNAAGSLTPLGWGIWFTAVTASGALVAAIRRDAIDLPGWPRSVRLQLWQGAALVLAALMAIGAYAFAIQDESSTRQFKYTELWLLGRPHGDPGRLAVGIRSGEAQTQQFDLEITLDRQPIAIVRSLTIAPGDIWTQEFAVPVLTTQQMAEARLYRRDNRLYRSASTLVPSF